MKLFAISNTETFLNKVLSCAGMVYSVSADGEKTDLKAMARYLERSGIAQKMNGIQEINLVFEHKDDAIKLLRFAAEMRRDTQVA